MAGLYGFVTRLYKSFNPPVPAIPADAPPPLKFGILGAAKIAPSALITPAKSHPEVVIYAVAARDLGKAQKFAKDHGIEKVYGGSGAYQELLNDPEIDAIYNPLPNGLHFEWTMKALQAGKHVLLEKPSADTAEETRQMFEFAEKKGLVLLEAFHNRFHPAVQRFKAILESGELGAVKSLEAKLAIPKGFIADDDIRYDFSLGGGALMDCGCYTISGIRYFSGNEPTAVLSATPTRGADPEIDRNMSATLELPSDATASIRADLCAPLRWGFIPRLGDAFLVIAKCEGGEARLSNFVMPTLHHTLTIKAKDAKGKEHVRHEKIYTFRDWPKGEKKDLQGEEWWTTYRYQLEAFVDKLRGRKPQIWVTAEDSINNMKAIELIYQKAAMKIRPASTFTLDATPASATTA